MTNYNTSGIADKMTVALNKQIPFDGGNGSCTVYPVSDTEVRIEVDSLYADAEEVKLWVSESDRGTVVGEESAHEVHNIIVELEMLSPGEKIAKEVGL